EISATKPAAKAKVIVVRTIRPKIRQHKAAYRGKPAATFGNLSIPAPKPGFLRFLSFSNHTLTLAGITGLVFAVLCLTRGWHSDLSLGYPVCASGLALIVTGVTGRFFAR
ncbi:MAG: hypothetical protein LBT89_00850, partial [Planctomycetaceae bacterium]|nr:hypothetical protein [Planctomycetaceae bacterium]